MNLAEYIAPTDVHLEVAGDSKALVLAQLVGTLGLTADDREAMLRILIRREESGSTGIGRRIAVPHCRTPVVKRLRVLYGRIRQAVPWGSVDGVDVDHVFLLVAPPIEVSNEYLPVLGRVAKLAKEPDVAERLRAILSVSEFLQLLAEKGV